MPLEFDRSDRKSQMLCLRARNSNVVIEQYRQLASRGLFEQLPWPALPAVPSNYCRELHCLSANLSTLLYRRTQRCSRDGPSLVEGVAYFARKVSPSNTAQLLSRLDKHFGTSRRA
jgi:hypothetical protein